LRRIPHYKSRDRGPLELGSRIHYEEGSVMKLVRRDVVTISPTTSIKSAAETMVKSNVRRLPVVEPGTKKLLGVVKIMDIVDFLGGGEKYKIVKLKFGGNFFAAVNEPVKLIMSKELVFGTTSMSVQDGVRTLLSKGVGGVPILDREGKVTGFLSEKDFIPYIPPRTNVKVSYYMSWHVVTAEPNLKIMDAARVMVSRGFRRLPVLTGGRLVGIITSMDILRYFGTNELFERMSSEKFEDAMSVGVEDIMTRDVLKISPEADIGEAAGLMRERGCGGLPVTSGEELVGIITERDLLRLLS
jgi:CBS domain-containing protein